MVKEKKNECILCGKFFCSKSNLIRHHDDIHDKKKIVNANFVISHVVKNKT